MTEEKMNRIAERNAQIFKTEWFQRKDGPFNLFQFPFFDFYAECWMSDANYERMSRLAIEYLNEIDRKCREDHISRAFFDLFMEHAGKQSDSAAAFAWGSIFLFQEDGELYTEKIGQIADELHGILVPEDEVWLGRGRFYLYKTLFCSAMTGVGNLDNMEDVDSTMEFIFKGLMHTGGREISQSDLDRNYIA